jgi:hypothetical protein
MSATRSHRCDRLIRSIAECVSNPEGCQCSMAIQVKGSSGSSWQLGQPPHYTSPLIPHGVRQPPRCTSLPSRCTTSPLPRPHGCTPDPHCYAGRSLHTSHLPAPDPSFNTAARASPCTPTWPMPRPQCCAASAMCTFLVHTCTALHCTPHLSLPRCCAASSGVHLRAARPHHHHTGAHLHQAPGPLRLTLTAALAASPAAAVVGQRQ